MLDLYHPAMRVWLDLYFADFAEVPQSSYLHGSSLIFALAVDPHLFLAADPFRSLLTLKIQHHAYLQILEPRHRLIAIVIRNEPIKPEAQFICEDEVVLA